MEFTEEFEALPSEEKIKRLKRSIEWFSSFADAVQGNSSTYDSACEYADEVEIEKYGRNYTGNFSSVHAFLEEFDLEDKADEVFGEGWEPENDIEQIQELLNNIETGYIVKAVEEKTARDSRIDDYIQVFRVT